MPTHSRFMTSKQCMQRAGRHIAGRNKGFQGGSGWRLTACGDWGCSQGLDQGLFCIRRAPGVQVDSAAVRSGGERKDWGRDQSSTGSRSGFELHLLGAWSAG